MNITSNSFNLICALKNNLIIGLFAFVILALVGPVQAQTSDAETITEVAAPSTNDIHEFQRLLGDPRIQNWLKQAADDNAAVTEAAAPVLGIREQFRQVLQQIRSRRTNLREALDQAGSTPATIRAIWTTEMSETASLQAITYLVIFLFVGAGFEWLYAQYTGNRLLKLELQKFENLKQRVNVASARATFIFGSLLVFALGSVGTFLAFDWPSMVEHVVLEILIVILIVRAAVTVSRFFISPNVEDLRLVPLNNREAKSLHLWLAVLVAAGATALAVSNVFEKLSTIADFQVPVSANLSVAAAGALLCVLIAVICIWRLSFIFAADHTKASGKHIRFWAIYLSVLVITTFVLWLIDTPSVMASVAILGALYPAAIAMRNWVDYLYDQAESAELQIEQSTESAVHFNEETDAVEEIDNTEPEPEPDPEAEQIDSSPPGRYDGYRPIVRRLVRFALVICAVAGLVLVWGNSVFALAGTQTTGGKIFKIAIDIIVALLIADLLWTWAKSAIDRRMADYVPPEDGHAPGPEARMATLLPLLRTILMVTLLTMVGLSVLASFGVNIAPLLAGAGVLGVAIGFGAQALVRDVVAGIFFLIDDAFRIGEYIEVEDLRGTVESMSIRSLRVRHHRGAVHTIPFGELKALTNYSRDWVIMKLEFRVPFETDMQLVKRLVKKIGADLKENPDFKDSIIETLKSQGVRRMEEFNMVIGVKFMTKPGEQWVIRREAYHKVRDAFEANGIGFAERNVKVEVLSDVPLNEATKKAVMGAAQNAIESNLPPAPAPDEP